MNTAEKNTVKVLIIDDDEDDYFLTSDLLSTIPNTYISSDWSYNYNEALERVGKAAHHVYFVDYRLGAKTGTDFIREARAAGCDAPIILLTGKGNRQIDLEAMHIGATDYLIKGELTTDKLERCIRYSLERVAGTRALRNSENKYRSIFEQSKDAIFLADQQFEIKDANPALCSLMSQQPCDITGTLFFTYLEDNAAKHLRHKLQEQGHISDELVELDGHDGEDRYCLLSISQQQSGENTIMYQGILHDITNLKKAEKANLQMEKLAAAGRLVRTLAHEVRNPLNNINMSMEQLTELVQEGEGSIYTDIIRRNSNRISDLIKELLNSSRPSEMRMEPMPLQTVLDKVVDEAIDRILLKHIRFERKITEEPILINADAEKMKIALLNILINAVEAVAEQSGHIVLRLAEDEGMAVLCIQDNGVGISKENVAKLFEPYFTSKRNGMGLGLAATLNIVQAHNGSIEVDSTLGQGTRFLVKFPKLV